MDDAWTDAALTSLLAKVRTIAVVGIKADRAADAHEVPAYMQAAGYRILPVSPKEREVLGERCVPALPSLETGCDLVNLFRAPAHLPGHTDEILSLSPRPHAVWMQLGISHAESAGRLRQAGILVVEDRCLMVEHHRLLGRG
ncbi:MAG: CoA-binding protein [Myxococcales bacterium]|nr:CoA-binding protein [Myxococcales bacterium]